MPCESEPDEEPEVLPHIGQKSVDDASFLTLGKPERYRHSSKAIFPQKFLFQKTHKGAHSNSHAIEGRGYFPISPYGNCKPGSLTSKI